MAWGKAGSTTLSSTGDTITVSSLTANKTNQFLLHALESSSLTTNHNLTFNNNSGSVYARRIASNGNADTTSVNRANIPISNASYGEHLIVMYVCSVPNEEKLMMSFSCAKSANGAGNVVSRDENFAKFVPSPDANITRVDINNSYTGDYASGSNLSALGSELTPASATTIETNSIFIETDTALRYWFNGTNWISPYGNYYYTFDTDPTGSSPQTYFYVDTANSWWYGYSGTNLTSNQGQYIDLGSDLSTDWTMAFKVLTNQDGNTNALNAIVGLVLGSTTGTDYNNSVHDYVNLWFNTDSGSRRDIRVSYGINAVTNSAAASEYLVDGTGAYGGTTLPDATNTTLYVLVKKSGTTVTAELYTDSALQNQYGVTATLTSVSVSGLRYVKLMGRTASGTDNQAIVKIQSVQIKDGDANWTPAWIEG